MSTEYSGYTDVPYHARDKQLLDQSVFLRLVMLFPPFDDKEAKPATPDTMHVAERPLAYNAKLPRPQ